MRINRWEGEVAAGHRLGNCCWRRAPVEGEGEMDLGEEEKEEVEGKGEGQERKTVLMRRRADQEWDRRQVAANAQPWETN